ncbi:hypothetical protein PF003_g21395 [Phytophthora fragariae]|nr:hypothetical protein PF003_g21395 [Phytophthora fragariae]
MASVDGVEGALDGLNGAGGRKDIGEAVPALFVYSTTTPTPSRTPSPLNSEEAARRSALVCSRLATNLVRNNQP